VCSGISNNSIFRCEYRAGLRIGMSMPEGAEDKVRDAMTRLGAAGSILQFTTVHLASASVTQSKQ
jgi:hypothetical protein